MCGIITIVNEIPYRAQHKKNCNKSNVRWYYIERNVSNDDDTYGIAGSGSEKWNGHALRLVSVAAANDEYWDDNIVQQSSKNLRKETNIPTTVTVTKEN